MGSPCTPPLEGLTFKSDPPKYQVSSQMVLNERKTSVSKMKMYYLALSPRPQIPFIHTPGQHILRAQRWREVRNIIQNIARVPDQSAVLEAWSTKSRIST